MLPDIPKLKQRLHDLLILGVEIERFQSSPLLSMTPKHPIMEGNKAFIIREDGVKEEVILKHSESSIEYDVRDVPVLTLEEFYSKYKTAINEIAVEQHNFYFEQLDEAIEKVGNVVDAKGREVTPDIIIEGFDKLSIDFDERGLPIWPTLLVGTDMDEKLKQIQDQMDKEPYKSRWMSLVERKRMEWLAREGNRTLVD